MFKLKSFFFDNIYPRQIIIKNAFWLYCSEISTKGLRILLFFVIARFLGPHNFGLFEYLFSFAGMFFVFSDLGVSTIFIRDYHQKKEKEDLISASFTIKLILSLIFFIIALFGFFFIKRIDSLLVYFIFILYYFFRNIENFFESYFIALQKTEIKFIFNLASSLSLFIFIVLGLLIFQNVLVVAFGYLISILVGVILGYLFFLREEKRFLKFNFSLFRYYLINGLPLSLFGLLGYIFFSSDKIILGHLKFFDDVGYYSAASRIVFALSFLPSVFYAAFFPYLSGKVKEVKTNDNFLRRIFFLSLLGSILVGFCIFILIYFLAPAIINFIFGPDYLDSILILQVLVFILIFLFPTTFLDYFLISYNKQWLNFFITLIPAFLNIVLNFIFIPYYGVFGAVYTSIFVQALNFILSLFISILILKGKLV